MMAVVTLNRLVFEQAITQVLESVRASVREFETAADKVQVRAGGALAQEVRDCGLAMRQEVLKAFEGFRRAAPPSQTGNAADRYPTPGERMWLVTGLVLALALFGVGVWVGTALR